MASAHDDFVPVTGGVDLPQDRIRGDMDQLRGLVAITDPDKHIARLLALHPDLRRKFGDPDLATLDEQAKRTLLEEMNELPGILSSSQTRQ